MLHSAAFPDTAPKEALPRKLFFDGAALDPDDLALVAGGLLSGCRPADPSLTQVQAISDWAAQRKPYPPYVFFELDAAGQSFLLQIYGNEGRPCRSVPSEKIPCVDLVFHIVQLAAVAVGYDHIGILLEFFNIIHDR